MLQKNPDLFPSFTVSLPASRIAIFLLWKVAYKACDKAAAIIFPTCSLGRFVKTRQVSPENCLASDAALISPLLAQIFWYTRSLKSTSICSASILSNSVPSACRQYGVILKDAADLLLPELHLITHMAFCQKLKSFPPLSPSRLWEEDLIEDLPEAEQVVRAWSCHQQ